MRKKLLMSPGPTPIPPKVSLSMAEPIIHHRAPEYSKVLDDVRGGLKHLFQTENEVLIFASSGTGAMEGAVCNTLSPGDRVLVVRSGKFGERWAEICQEYQVKAINIDVDWGKAVNPELIAQHLKNDESIKAVFTQASETSTGVKHPIEDIAGIVKNYDNTLMIVDAITGIGVFDIPIDRWGLDVVVAGSQKALMLPPGLAFASVSKKAWGFVEKSTLPKYYFNFKKELKNLSKNQNAYTPAISLIVGLQEVLRQIRDDGLPNVFAHHEKLAKAARGAFVAIGLELFAPDSPSDAVTAVKAPANIDGQQVVKILREKHGITIAGGQSQAKGKIFRIAHMGYISEFDLIATISAVEMTLDELGYQLDFGKGVKAAIEILK